jgi:oligopeptide transport system ATP-binding protein
MIEEAVAMPVLEVRNLVTRFRTREGVVHAVDGISYSLGEGEALGIVGESGSGKSVAALSILGLVPEPGAVEGGEVLLHGRNLLDLPPDEMRRVRGREIAMVFQDPMTSLNPVLSVGYQLTEAIERHLRLTSARARDHAAELLTLVGIPNARERLADHPHQFSGGQRQRVMIAMALSCRPSLLIADEPTTALDVTIQAQIVELVKRLQSELGMSILWITHDLALVAGLVHRVAVMYAGHIVEQAPVRELYRRPRHPYTIGLLRSMPSLTGRGRRRLASIEGAPPELDEAFRCCPFAPRCAHAGERCHAERPPLMPEGAGHAAACWRSDEIAELERGGRVE